MIIFYIIFILLLYNQYWQCLPFPIIASANVFHIHYISIESEDYLNESDVLTDIRSKPKLKLQKGVMLRDMGTVRIVCQALKFTSSLSSLKGLGCFSCWHLLTLTFVKSPWSWKTFFFFVCIVLRYGYTFRFCPLKCLVYMLWC